MAHPRFRLCLFTLGVVLLGILFLGLTLPAAAQGKASGKYMAQAFLRVFTLSKRADEIARYGYSDGICIVGGWVDSGQTMPFGLTLESGSEYMVLAVGDDDAEDVDLEIVNSEGTVMESDVKTAAVAAVPFTPRKTGVYTLNLKLYKSRGNVPCVCMLTVLKKDGFTLPLENLAQAGMSMVDGVALLDEAAARKSDRRIHLRRAKNQWAFFGAVLKSGTGISASNMDLGAGPRIFYAAADKSCDDCNLYLQDNDGGPIKGDARSARDALILHEPRGGQHCLRIENASSRAPAVCLMGIFEAR